MAVIARDGYAALPTTPRQDCVQDVEALCTQANLQHPEHLHDSPKQQISNGAALKQQQQVFPSSVPKADQLRLTPVRRVRRAQVNCNRPPHNESSLYAQANARSSHIPGPGQYSSGSDSQLRKQDFRRPHDPMTDGPFFLQEHDESTRVKAMAHSLKTPDSGLGPGLYEPAPASLSRHAPQVVIGGYAPRQAVSKLRGISYSRSVMAVHIPVVGEDDEGDGSSSNEALDAYDPGQPHWASNTRTQGRANSTSRPCSGRPSDYSSLHTSFALLAQPRKPVTGVAGHGMASVLAIPHQRSRSSWKQGCFQPPWASMRRRTGVTSAPPSDWGWVALNPDQSTFGKGAWAGDGRLEVNHQSLLTPDNSGPLLRTAEVSPHTNMRGSNSLRRLGNDSPSLQPKLKPTQSLDQYIAFVPATQAVSHMLPDRAHESEAVHAACSLVLDAELVSTDVVQHDDISSASKDHKPCMLLRGQHGLGYDHQGLGGATFLPVNASNTSSSCIDQRPRQAAIKAAFRHDRRTANADDVMCPEAASVQPCRAVLQNLSMFAEAEHCRHRQATRAAKHAQVAQEQQMLWEAKSRAGNSGALPMWLQADHHS